MAESRRYLVLDYETRSECDLGEAGAWEYSRHPTTKILCVGWRFGTRQGLGDHEAVRVWSPALSPGIPGELFRALCDPDVKLVAHNAFFEQSITRNVLSRRPEFLTGTVNPIAEIPVSRWICTASLARAHAFPGKLAHAGAAMGLAVQKDMEGHRLMLKMSKPRKPTKNNPRKWHNSLRDLRRLMQYCATDVQVEVDLLLRLPPLIPAERAVWELDQKINLRGFAVDRELALSALDLIDLELSNLNAEAREIGNGAFETTNQRDAVLRWLVSAPGGTPLPDLKAKTVEDALKGTLVLPDSPARRVLEIRQASSRSSTSKYLAYRDRSVSDERIRDHTVYHVATTGRFAGAGLQPQNFPQGKIKNTEAAIEIVKERDLELVRLIYGDPLTALASCLRGGIVASEGKELFCADFASIEVRVLFWIAKHVAGIQAYERDQPIYEEMAAEIFNRSVAKIINPSPERDLGKRVILGGGFGMGWPKFYDTCVSYNQPVTKELAQAAISTYRRVHHPVVALWGNLERAALAATRKPGTRYRINRTTWFVEKKILYCELPSGRRLTYHEPEIRQETTTWGEKRPKLYHRSYNTKVKGPNKWIMEGTYGGRLTENVVQAVARDFMVAAMLRLDRAGYEILITVHDEVLAEREVGQGSLDEFLNLMQIIPDWGQGCPVKASGWSGFRYRK